MIYLAYLLDERGNDSEDDNRQEKKQITGNISCFGSCHLLCGFARVWDYLSNQMDHRNLLCRMRDDQSIFGTITFRFCCCISLSSAVLDGSYFICSKSRAMASCLHEMPLLSFGQKSLDRNPHNCYTYVCNKCNKYVTFRNKNVTR